MESVVRQIVVRIDGNKKWVHSEECTPFGETIRQVARDKDPCDFRWGGRTRETVTTLADLLRVAAAHGPLPEGAPFNFDSVEKITRLLGYHLYDLLFGDEGTNEVLQDALQCAWRGKLHFVRIELEFSGDWENELASLPWEYMRMPPERGRPEYLARTSQLVINRRLHLPGAILPEFLAEDTLRLLVVAASPPRPDPGKTEPLAPVSASAISDKLAELKKALGDRLIVSALEDPPMAQGYLAKDYQPEATRELLRAALHDNKPHVVHFIGHGSHGPDQKAQLALTGEDGCPDWIGDEEFADLLLWEQPRGLRLVILQACESALPSQYVAGASGVASKVARKPGIQAVVAMQYRINAMAANTFATSFYDALLKDALPVDEAVSRARQEMFASGDEATRSSVSIPVIYPLDYARLMVEPKQPSDGKVPPPPPPPPALPFPCLRPGCEALVGPDNPRCGNCGLLFVCPVCRKRWDPMGTYCTMCPPETTTLVKQPKWPPDSDVAGAFTPTRSTVAGVS